MLFWDFNTTKVADARLLYCGPDWVRNIINRPYHGLLYIRKGAYIYTHGDTKLTLDENTIIFLEKGSTYNIASVADSELIVLSFDEPPPHIFCESKLIKIKENDIVAVLLWELVETFMKVSPVHKIKCKSIFYNIAYQIINKYRLLYESPAKDRLLSTLNYMNEHYGEKVIISELAKSVFLSENHYRRLFKKHYGISPLEYLNIVRINKAKELINLNKYTLNEIASMTGFSDIYYFSRVFKKHTGMAPSTYKNT